MKAVVEEGDESLAARMQHLALSEAALPRHLLTAFYTKKPAGNCLFKNIIDLLKLISY